MPTFVQSTSGGVSAVFASPVALGNTIVLAVAGADLSSARIRPSTSRLALRDAITVVGPAKGTGVAALVAFWKVSESGPLVIELSGVASPTMAAFEFAPPATIEPDFYDTGIALIGTGFATGTGTSADAGAISAIIGPNSLVVSAVALSASATVTVASGYSAGPAQGYTSGNPGLATQYNPSAGVASSYDAPFTLSVSQAWAAAAVALADGEQIGP